MGRSVRPLAMFWVAVVLLAACSAIRDEPVTLRVLASSERADLQPLLADLRADTGIELELDLRGSVDAANELTSGDYQHDLAVSAPPAKCRHPAGARSVSESGLS
ncbi:MAG: hypothetical protein ACRDRG_03915 [Pseudonocardiaceae bacterium]